MFQWKRTPLSIALILIFFCFATAGRAWASGAVSITTPSNGATVSGTVPIAGSISSAVVWINFDVDYSYTAGTTSWSWDSTKVTNGNHTISVSVWDSSKTLIGTASIILNVANAAPTNAVGPAGYPLTTPVGYRDPISFGATGNGTTDDTAAFQNAVYAGNVYVSQPGTYLIVGQILLPSNRVFQCAPGVTLETTRHDIYDTGMLRLDGTNNSSILGCNLIGTNTASPPALAFGTQGNSLISLWGATNNLIAANTCKWSFSNSCIHIADRYDGTGAASTFNIIRNNAFGPTALYGLGIINGTDNQVLWNSATDANIGSEAEPGQAAGTNARNTYDHNIVTKDTSAVSAYGVFLTGGAAIAGFDYSTNVVSNSTVSGSGSMLMGSGAGAIPAQYINDSCINGCVYSWPYGWW